MTEPQTRIHTLSGDITVDVAGQAPATATETTLPIRPLTPTRLRLLTDKQSSLLRRPAVRLAAGLAAVAALVLLLRDHNDGATTAQPVTTTTVIVESESTVLPTPSTTTPALDPAAATPQHPAEEQFAQLPLAVVGQSLPQAPADPDPGADPGPEVLHPTTTVAVYHAPGEQAIARLPVRQVFTPTWVPVVQRQPGWARVLLPTRPLDGGVAPTGWVYLDQSVVLSQSAHRIDIDHRDGSAAVLTRVGRITNESASGKPTVAPAATPRTFVAITPATVAGSWLARIWVPLLIQDDHICRDLLAAPVIPALPQASPLGQVNDQGCVSTPDGLRRPLSSVTAGTIVLQR